MIWKNALLLAALAAVAAGCAPKKEEASQSQRGTEAPVVAQNEAPQEPAGEASTEPTTPPTPEAKSPLDPIREELGTPKIQVAKPTPAKTDRWSTSAMRPLELAQTTEEKLRELRNVSLQTMVQVEFDGGNGASIGYSEIRSASQLRSEYAHLQTQPIVNLVRETLVVNGSDYATHDTAVAWTDPKPLSALKNEAPTDPMRWASRFPRGILSTFAGGTPITSLVETLDKPDSGFNVTSEQRYVAFQGQQMLQRRLHISRTAEQAKSKGELTIEIMIDGQRLLPVTIRTNVEEKGKPPQRFMWTAQWNFAPNQNFAPETFEMPTVASRRRA
jgi:hypothetical protein